MNRQKERYDAMQVKQRMAEIEKKREMFNNYWNQTIKPKNKVLDVSYQKVVLAEDPIVRTGGMLWSLKKRETDDESYDADD